MYVHMGTCRAYVYMGRLRQMSPILVLILITTPYATGASPSTPYDDTIV